MIITIYHKKRKRQAHICANNYELEIDIKGDPLHSTIELYITMKIIKTFMCSKI